MLGMIILCLEKVNILFNQTGGEWVAISRHFLETGIQGVQMEIRFCFFFFPLDFLGDWNPLISSEGCTEPLENSWDGGMWRFQLIRIPYTADATGISSIPFQAVWSWQMRWETSPSETQTCCFPLPRQHQGNTNHGWIFLSCSQGAPQQLLWITHCPGDKSVLVLEANSGISAQGFPQVCQKGQEI